MNNSEYNEIKDNENSDVDQSFDYKLVKEYNPNILHQLIKSEVRQEKDKAIYESREIKERPSVMAKKFNKS